MKCKKCGSDIPSDSKFCSACGDNLQNQNVSDSETTQEKDTLNKQNENDYNQSPKEVNNINEQPKNKKIFKIVISVCLVVITIVVIISVIGVNSGMSEEISTVKNGHFFDYPEEDGYTTIGTAFENYFDNTKWYYFVSDDGFDVVEFEGTFSYYDKDTSCCLQFKLYDDNHFEAYALEFNGVPQSKFMKNTLVDEVMEDARYIYDY